MKLRFIVLVLHIASILALPSAGDKLKQIFAEPRREKKFPPSRILLVVSSTDANTDPRCSARKSRSALSAVGRLGVPHNTDSGPTCCSACLGTPDGECRSWWRDGGRNQPCYLNSNRPGSS